MKETTKERPGATSPANALFTIRPYLKSGVWQFDDPRVGLVEEPFIAGIPEMLEELCAMEGYKPKQFTRKKPAKVTFSIHPFPKYQAELTLSRKESGGAWYIWNPEHLDQPLEGWLCPALLLYYPKPPKRMYVKLG